jgi:hypothetical protein
MSSRALEHLRRSATLCLGLLALLAAPGAWAPLRAAPAPGGSVNGPYSFELEIGPRCLDGVYPLAIAGASSSASGELELHTALSGQVAGSLSLDGLTLPVTGKASGKGGALKLVVKGQSDAGSLTLSGALVGGAIVGKAAGKGAFAAFKGGLEIDVSGAAPLRLRLDLNVQSDVKGRVSGAGTASACSESVAVAVKGKAGATLALTALGDSFKFSGKGRFSAGAFSLAWKSKAAGSSAAGAGLSILSRGALDPVALAVEPAAATLAIGETLRLRVVGTLPGGREEDVSARASYRSGDDAVATVSADGTVRAVAIGETDIVAEIGGLSARAAITVLHILEALPGPDRSLTLGETVILQGGARGAVGELRFSWSLVEKPPGSAFALLDPSAADQVVQPDLAGDYLLTLVVADELGESSIASVRLHVLSDPMPDPVEIRVAGVSFSAEVDGIVDPSSSILVQLEGPVDGASVSAGALRLRRGDAALDVELSFDPAANSITVTPRQALPLDAILHLEVDGLRAAVEPYRFQAFSTSFLTPKRRLARVGGLVLDPERTPLPRVTLHIGDQSALTDFHGAFLFDDVPEGEYLLKVDPSTVESEVVYAPLHFEMHVVAGPELNTIGQPIVMTSVDVHAEIDYPAERVLENPRLPGLRIDFTGSALRWTDGSSYTGPLSVSPVVPSDVPMPFPGLSELYWTIQPAGLRVQPPARITVPLPIPMDPGDEVELWAFDHFGNFWANYGMGVVDVGGQTATASGPDGLPFTGWGARVTRREVKRTIKGKVQDAESLPLHGVRVDAAGNKSVFSDYDNGSFDGTVDGDYEAKDVLVGYNVYIDGNFDHFEPALVTIKFFANDIAGAAFNKLDFVDIAGIANVNSLDGNLPQNIERPTQRFDDYKAVDSSLQIHLHKDLKQDRNSHVLEASKHGGPIASSQRYRKEVAAVSRKLASMGFRETDAGGFLNNTESFSANSAVERAVQLFRTVWFSAGLSSAFKQVKRKVDADTLQAMNGIQGVIWTTNTPIANGFTYAGGSIRQRWMNGTPPERLKGVTLKSNITDAARATGGQRMNAAGVEYGETHLAGSEVDVRWLGPDGNPGQGDFFRVLTYRENNRNRRTTVTFTKDSQGNNVMPLASEEFTEAERDAGVTEDQAAKAGKTWRTREDYSREKTQEIIDQLRAQGTRQIVFNDPGVTGVNRVKGHTNHVHFGYAFVQANVHPKSTDGAPEWRGLGAPAGGGAGGDAFQLIGVDPPHSSHPVDPGGPIVLEFNRPVDAASLAGRVQLAGSGGGPALPLAIRVSEDGLRVELIPSLELPEHAGFALELGDGIADRGGRPLELAGGGIASTFITGLTAKIVTARFENERYALDRASGALGGFQILGGGDGAERDVSYAIDSYLLIDEEGHSYDPAIGDDGRVGRVVNGRATLYASLTNGVGAAAVLEADLFAAPTVVAPVIHAGDAVELRFGEAIALPRLEVASAQVRSNDGSLHGGAWTLSADRRTLAFTAGDSLDQSVGHRLEVILRVRLGDGSRIEAVTAGEFFAIGSADTDKDGVPDDLELLLGLNPRFPDSDFDGIADGDEDNDGDGLSNAYEFDARTDPRVADTDGDGASDGVELRYGCSATLAETSAISGRIVGPGGNPAAGARVRAFEVETGAGADGRFTLPPVPSCRPLKVFAEAEIDGRLFEGSSAVVPPGFGPAADVGDIELRPSRPLFAGPRFGAGIAINGLEAADLNRDGNADLAATNLRGGDRGGVLFFGDGRGGFAEGATFDVGDQPSALAVLDLNGDDRLDVAVLNGGLGTLTSVLADAGGGSRPPRSFPSGADPVALAGADFDADGFLDLAAAHREPGEVVVHFGTGDGAFAAPKRMATGAGPSSLAAGELDGAPGADLVVLHLFGNDVAVFFADGNGDFTAGPRFTGILAPTRTALGDLDGDGRLDLMILSLFSGLVVHRNRGGGEFEELAPQSIALGVIPDKLVLADMNRDAVLDAIVANGSGDVVVLPGRGDGAFGEPKFSIAGDFLDVVAVADFDGDGIMDLAGGSTSAGGMVLEGVGDGSLPSWEPLVTMSTPGVLASGDLDRDGAPDVVSAALGAGSIESFLARSEGGFAAAVASPVPGFPGELGLADATGDGILDAVVVDILSGTRFLLAGRGDGGFGEARLLAAAPNAQGTAFADFDGDGSPDLAAVLLTGGLSVFPGRGGGDFGAGVEIDAEVTGFDVVIADATGDGIADIAALSAEDAAVKVFPGDGAGGFGAPSRIVFGGFAFVGLASADLDDNGAADFILVGVDAPPLLVALSLGSGAFTSPQTIEVGSDAGTEIVTADVDGDGGLDIVLSGVLGSAVVVRGLGDGAFRAPERFASPSGIASVLVLDADRDGRLDLAAPRAGAQVVLHALYQR